MPSIRYTRDKRGYETTCVVHHYRANGGPGPARVLYLFRSPSHVTVGRRPLDDEARVALEHTHPDLSFDWQGIGREMSSLREPATPRPWREREPRGARPEPARTRSKPEDLSVLGRTLGAEQAAHLRARYAELLQRVERRSRTPEERQELIARLGRLNPDGWSDDKAVLAGMSTIEADWEAVRSVLPQRRRGRRGGRRRDEGTGEDTRDAGSSAIIPDEGDVDDASQDRQVDGPDPDAGSPGDDDRLGTGTGDGFPSDD